jgi:hypothetical protein
MAAASNDRSKIGILAFEVRLVKPREQIDIVDVANSQTFACAANDIPDLVAQASPQGIDRLTAIQKQRRVGFHLVAGMQKGSQVGKSRVQDHFDVAMSRNLIEQVGHDRMGRSDSGLGLARLRLHHRAKDPCYVRHLTNLHASFRPLHESQRPDGSAATQTGHLPPASRRECIKPPVLVEDGFSHLQFLKRANHAREDCQPIGNIPLGWQAACPLRSHFDRVSSA